MNKKPIKLHTFQDHLKKSLKDPVSKARFDTWGEAIRDEIKPRQKQIAQLRKKIRWLKNSIHLVHDKIAYGGYKENGGSVPILGDICEDLQKILEKK